MRIKSQVVLVLVLQQKELKEVQIHFDSLAMAESIASQITRLQDSLHKLAPKFCPVVVPKQFKKFQKSPTNWACTEAQSDQISLVLEEEYKRKTRDSNDTELVLLARIDMKTHKWRIIEARWCDPLHEHLFSLEGFLTFSTEMANDAEGDIVRHTQLFLKENGHQVSDTFKLQQSYSLAYSLKILLGNIPSVLPSFGVSTVDIGLPLTANSNMDQVCTELRALFAAGRGEKRVSKEQKKRKSSKMIGKNNAENETPRKSIKQKRKKKTKK